MTSVDKVTIRDAEDELHLEFRFTNGEKYAAITINKQVPDAELLADSIASSFNFQYNLEDDVSNIVSALVHGDYCKQCSLVLRFMCRNNFTCLKCPAFKLLIEDVLEM